MSQTAVAIKGFRQGVMVKLGEGDWSTCLRELEARVEAAPAFFRNSRVALDVGGRELGRTELEQVRDLLAGLHVELWAVSSTNGITRLVARDLGMVVDLETPPARQQSLPGPMGADSATDGLVIRRTLRSGQILRYPGHIVVIGDVNPGAEVIAGGNIVVWGKARGVLHAGALGDEQAVICALDLEATQLRIAGHIARAPEDRPRKPTPEMAMVQDGQIVALPWRGGD